MGGFEFCEEFFDVAAFAPVGLIEALADALVSVGASGNVEESLIGASTLKNGGLAFSGKLNRAFALLQSHAAPLRSFKHYWV
jgi:hypothetical protein